MRIVEIHLSALDVTENTRLYRDLAEREAEDSAPRGSQHYRRLHLAGSVKFMHVLLHVLRDAAGNREIVGAFIA